MKLSFITLFEGLISPYFKESILARAHKKGLFELEFIELRAYASTRLKKVDDYKIGGGAGLVMQAEPLFECLSAFCGQNPKAHLIFPNPSGKIFIQKDAKRLAQKEHIAFVCGRYEGIDERVIEVFANENLSLGDFVLTGGELAALAMSDAILRNIKGVLGNSQSLAEESYENELLEAPSFSKPFEFCYKNEKFLAPSAFLKGNHAKIASLKQNLALCKSRFYNPALYQQRKTRTNDEK